ncbi:MAG: radical SAM protein [Halanaerobiales bacterium]|nr:radical SAM protein [Halanaerobiales bacterium]
MSFLINNPQYWRTDLFGEKDLKETELAINKEGQIKLPAELINKLNLNNNKYKVTVKDGNLYFKKVDPELKKIYIEPTSDCNLNCKTCVRHSWDESMGFMDIKDYKNLIKGLQNFNHLKRISFWGIGEPLYHNQLAKMIELAKGLDMNTQVITNGLLLTEKRSKKLLKAGLDSIVISIDGTSSETFSDIRSGADLKEVLESIKLFKKTRDKMGKSDVEIGLEYVLMKSNIKELKSLRKLVIELGVSFIFLTNVLPYTEEMVDEILYSYSISRSKPQDRTMHRPEVYLPPTDLREDTVKNITGISGKTSSISTNQIDFDPHRGYCKFVEEGSIAVNWKGEVSPCVPLMHSYDCYIRERKKHIKKYVLGNIKSEKISTIWNSEEFKSFRKKVIEFPFSECTQCSGCDMSKSNQEDCHGNQFPVCGDCLWAKGVIQCP